MPFRRLSIKASRSWRRRSISTPQALSTGVASSSSVMASSRCSSVAYSCRRSPASANARWRDFSRFLDNMDIEPPRQNYELRTLLFLQRALQRMLVLARVVDGLGDLRLGHLVSIDTTYSHALLVDVEHDLGRLFAGFLEDVLQDVDDELHRSVIVIQHQHLVHRRLLGADPGQCQRPGTALVIVAVAVVPARGRL